MKTVGINVYSFEELDEDIQEKVIERNRYYSVECVDWYDLDIEYHVEKLEELGYPDALIEFSGFYSQGDGAMFTSDCDLRKLIIRLGMVEHKEMLLTMHEWYGLRCEIKSSRRWHTNSSSMYVSDNRYYAPGLFWEAEGGDYETIEYAVNQLFGAIEADAKEQADSIFHSLMETYEYLISDNYVADNLRYSGMEFFEDGTDFSKLHLCEVLGTPIVFQGEMA